MKGGYSLFEESIPLLIPREKDEGPCPSTPHIGRLGLEQLFCLRNALRCTWLRHGPSAIRGRDQPRPTPWGASDVRWFAGACGAVRHCLRLAARRGVRCWVVEVRRCVRARHCFARRAGGCAVELWAGVHVGRGVALLAALGKCGWRHCLRLAAVEGHGFAALAAARGSSTTGG